MNPTMSRLLGRVMQTFKFDSADAHKAFVELASAASSVDDLPQWLRDWIEELGLTPSETNNPLGLDDPPPGAERPVTTGDFIVAI